MAKKPDKNDDPEVREDEGAEEDAIAAEDTGAGVEAPKARDAATPMTRRHVVGALVVGLLAGGGGGFAVGHNGNLTNGLTLRSELVKGGALMQSTTDTEVILHLVAQSKRTRFVDRFIEALRAIEGAYALVALTNKKLPYCIKVHPGEPNMLLAGCSNKHIVQYDMRSGKVEQVPRRRRTGGLPALAAAGVCCCCLPACCCLLLLSVYFCLLRSPLRLRSSRSTTSTSAPSTR